MADVAVTVCGAVDVGGVVVVVELLIDLFRIELADSFERREPEPEDIQRERKERKGKGREGNRRFD